MTHIKCQKTVGNNIFSGISLRCYHCNCMNFTYRYYSSTCYYYYAHNVRENVLLTDTLLSLSPERVYNNGAGILLVTVESQLMESDQIT